MSSPPPQKIPPNCNYATQLPPDPYFPLTCSFDYTQAYCCQRPSVTGDFVTCTNLPFTSIPASCTIGPPGCNMSYPFSNDEGQPMLKTALNGTAMSPWVRIAFQQYCDNNEDADATDETILTMGNCSQGTTQDCQNGTGEICKAAIKSFQYGWGSINQGNRCRITILDQKGSSFQEWVQRMGINPEGDSAPVQGKYRMKVQFGWYVTGGGDTDVCGQPPMPINGTLNDSGTLPVTPPAPGFNSAYIICSPVMWFLTDWINVHYEQGKFIYELEGIDLLERGQEQYITQIFGREGDQMYFTKAVELLGLFSFPPFRVEFKGFDSNRKVVPLQFVKREGDNYDRQYQSDSTSPLPPLAPCLGYGPFGVWRPDNRPPLSIIHEWLKEGVAAFDQTLQVTSNKGRVGITMNYDPTYKFTQVGKPGATTDDICAVCSENLPQYGRLILWANGIPYCQGNFNEAQINDAMKAVYVVNGGNCSPVLQFAPAFRWHTQAAQRFSGSSAPVTGAQVNQSSGRVLAGCPITTSSGNIRSTSVPATGIIGKTLNAILTTMEAQFHHVMANLGIGAIEADLRVQGDPSDWLCSPINGYGRCVGIVFINPFFLVPGQNPNNCPVWAANDPDDPDAEMQSICNELLTNKGWFIMGVEHQIKDGQYITTLKLKLVAPSAELNIVTPLTAGGAAVTGAVAGGLLATGSPAEPTVLGAWAPPTGGGVAMPYGGQGSCLTRFPVGGQGSGWFNNMLPPGCPGTWVGGGSNPACGDGYTEVPPDDLPPD